MHPVHSPFRTSAPPDRGLATKQFSGKKKEKFRITIGFACNADGSEKLDPIYIGKSKKPHAFGGQTPEQKGFYYRNNKKAWMTAVLFEEFVIGDISSHVEAEANFPVKIYSEA
jgi:hypothetical protein